MPKRTYDDISRKEGLNMFLTPSQIEEFRQGINYIKAVDAQLKHKRLRLSRTKK